VNSLNSAGSRRFGSYTQFTETKGMQGNNTVAKAMTEAWERIKLNEKQEAMAETERAAFAALARQLGRPVEQMRR
jgi:hypothetical protein